MRCHVEKEATWRTEGLDIKSQPNLIPTTSETSSKRHCLAEPVNSWNQKIYNKKGFCFKPLSFLVVYHATIDNSNKTRYLKNGVCLNKILKHVALALGPGGGQKLELLQETMSEGFKDSSDIVTGD